MLRVSRILRAADAPGPRPERRTAIVNVTSRCNLRCLHCYAASSPESACALSFERARALAAELASCGFNAVTISGGEPLLHPDVHRIAGAFRDLGFFTALSTNGTLLADEGTCRAAAEHFDYIGISLDGDEETHARLRGARSYERTILGLRRAVATGVPVGLRLSLTRENVRGLRDVVVRARAEGARKVYVSHIVPSGRAARELLVPPRVLARTMLWLFGVAERHDDLEFVTGNLEADAVALVLYVRKLRPSRAAAVSAALARWGGNAAGERVVNVDSRGAIRPDPFCPAVGHLDDGFARVWNESPVLLALREREKRIGGACAACPYLAMCRGGSRGRAFGVTGDLFAPDPACYRTEFEDLLACRRSAAV